MKQKFFKGVMLVTCATTLLSSCIDDKYDLSDIDSTSRFEVNSLALPINVDEITMGNIIDLDKSDAIKIIDDKYVIVKDGIVKAEQISIPAISVKAPSIKPDDTVINTEMPFRGKSEVAGLPPFELKYELGSEPSECFYSTNNISDYIIGLESCECRASLDITISLLEAETLIKGAKFTDVIFQLPKGLILSETAGGVYDINTGELSFGEQYATGSAMTIHLVASGMDFTKSNFNYDYANHSLTISEEVYLKSGWVIVSSDDIISTEIPASLTLRTSYALSDINIDSFTGTIKYNVENVDIPEIGLGDIPDLFMQSGTDIAVTNPCVYLQFNNPLQQYSLTARTGLALTAYRPNEADKIFTLDEENPYIVVNTNHANSLYNFCLSPKAPAKYDTDFADAEHIGFKSLSYLLSGNGLPQRIGVDLVDPCIPEQRVVKFPLGMNLGEIGGKYKLVAPLEFMPGSKIIYSDKTDGWGDEDIQNMVIEKLEVTLKVSTDIPVSMDFTGYPLDAQGNRINNVEITGATIDAYANNQEVTLSITGSITSLDGLEYQAIATTAAPSATLSPSMSVRLTDVKPVVSGYYEKEL